MNDGERVDGAGFGAESDDDDVLADLVQGLIIRGSIDLKVVETSAHYRLVGTHHVSHGEDKFALSNSKVDVASRVFIRRFTDVIWIKRDCCLRSIKSAIDNLHRLGDDIPNRVGRVAVEGVICKRCSHRRKR